MKFKDTEYIIMETGRNYYYLFTDLENDTYCFTDVKNNACRFSAKQVADRLLRSIEIKCKGSFLVVRYT